MKVRGNCAGIPKFAAGRKRGGGSLVNFVKQGKQRNLAKPSLSGYQGLRTAVYHSSCSLEMFSYATRASYTA